MPHLALHLVATFALLGAAGEPTVEVARKAMRPSLVEVCQRAVGHLKKKDWKRVNLSLTATHPMARSLDARWKTRLAPSLDSALEKEDTGATLSSLVSIVYWDARDLLAPLAAENSIEPDKAKTQLLKATQDLRYLAPLIRASSKGKKADKAKDGELIYARLEKLLVSSIRQLPTSAEYGRNLHWREDVQADVQRFLAALEGVLPQLHGRTVREESQEDKPGDESPDVNKDKPKEEDE